MFNKESANIVVILNGRAKLIALVASLKRNQQTAVKLAIFNSSTNLTSPVKASPNSMLTYIFKS